MDFFSKSDQVDLHDVPKPPPDTYVTLQRDSGGAEHYFLDILDDGAHLMADASKKIKRYISYRKSGAWATTDTPFPTIIFICSSEDTRKKIQKRCEVILNKAWALDITCRAVTFDKTALD